MHLLHPSGVGSDCDLLSIRLFPPLSIIRSHHLLPPHPCILQLNLVFYLSNIISGGLNFFLLLSVRCNLSLVLGHILF